MNAEGEAARSGAASTEAQSPRPENVVAAKRQRVYICDRCGFEMTEKNCKIVCRNCGSRYDCSDLNIYFD